jgi:hypothetical protein
MCSVGRPADEIPRPEATRRHPFLSAKSLQMGDVDQPKPVLRRLFEAVACILQIDGAGEHTLELRFADGYLVSWHVHGSHTAKTLGDFDAAAGWLTRQLDAAPDGCSRVAPGSLSRVVAPIRG